jgi:hypothetical protein
MAALASASQNSTTSRRRSVHQRSLPSWLAQGVGLFDHPPAARLDRSRHPRLAIWPHHAPLGQNLPAGLVVVAGVQVHDRLGGQRPDRTDGVQGRREQAIVAVVDRGSAASGMPANSTAIERFSPCLRRSTGLGPATWPPQGALVVHPSMARCSSSKPNSWSSAASTSRRSWSATPAVAVAEHQDLDELVEHDPVGDAGPVAAERMVDPTSGEECGDLDPQASRTDDSRAGMRPPRGRRV